MVVPCGTVKIFNKNNKNKLPTELAGEPLFMKIGQVCRGFMVVSSQASSYQPVTAQTEVD